MSSYIKMFALRRYESSATKNNTPIPPRLLAHVPGGIPRGGKTLSNSIGLVWERKCPTVKNGTNANIPHLNITRMHDPIDVYVTNALSRLLHFEMYLQSYSARTNS